MALDGHAEVGDDALAEPADEIEADAGGDALDEDDRQQAEEVWGDRRRRRAGLEAPVDDQPQPGRDGDGRHRGDEQRDQRGREMAGIGFDEPP